MQGGDSYIQNLSETFLFVERHCSYLYYNIANWRNCFCFDCNFSLMLYWKKNIQLTNGR
jgi:hypothetical protein